jgi:hypothetical protein
MYRVGETGPLDQNVIERATCYNRHPGTELNQRLNRLGPFVVIHATVIKLCKLWRAHPMNLYLGSPSGSGGFIAFLNASLICSCLMPR